MSLNSYGWMDKATGEVFLLNGQPLKTEKTFVATEANGEVTLSVTVDARHFAEDVDLVAFEEVFKDNILVATYKDINDASKIVTVKQLTPELKTAAYVNDKKRSIASKCIDIKRQS